MNKSISTAACVFMAVLVLVWIVCGFVAWEWNPKYWAETSRQAFAFWGITISGIAAAFSFLVNY